MRRMRLLATRDHNGPQRLQHELVVTRSDPEKLQVISAVNRPSCLIQAEYGPRLSDDPMIMELSF